MPRPPRSFAPGGHYHLTACGNNDGAIVVDDVDRARFVRLLDRVSTRFLIDLYAWCLMTNHYHLVIATSLGSVSQALQYLNREYARGFNERHSRRGLLFESRFRATTLVDEQHRERAIEYVLANPVRAGIVAAPGDWPWAGAVGAAP